VATSPTANRIREANWWDKDGDELAETLSVVFTIVRDENEWRTDKDEYHWGLYEGNGVGGVTTMSRRGYTYEAATLPDNVTKMAVDTLTAKVATIRPIPQVLTARGNWKDQRRARKLRQFGEGEFYRQEIHEKLAPRIIKDALISRAGVVQVYVDPDCRRPTVERVHAWTLYCDDWDAEHGEPMTMMRLRTMDRTKAMAKFGTTAKLKEKIRNASRFSSSIRLARDEERASTVERVELLEAWYRCPDHENLDEKHKCMGRHVIIVDNALLFEEDWPHDYFPFAVLTYDTPNTGRWGTGLVQMLEGYQVSINDANTKLDEMYALSGKGVLLRDGSGVFNQEIQNGLRILHCRPGPYEPQVFDLDLVNEHVRMRGGELVERALEAAGVSQMSAQSQKPAGIEAGVALQTLDDIESQRHIVFGRRFESWCMDVMRLLIDCAKQIAEKYGDYAVKVPMKGAYLDLKWSDVHIDGFQLQLQSVGQLYMSFAGRLDKLKTLFEMGAIDAQTFMRHLDAGDIQSELDLATVDRLCVDEMIEAMLDSDKTKTAANDNDDYIAPNGYLPLDWAHKRAHQRRLQAQMDGAPQHVLDLLGRFIDDLDYLMGTQAPTGQAAGGAPPADMMAGPPPGGPAAPPPMPPPGGPPMLPQATAPAGDQLMMPPPGMAA
jgi:hypothetical protein